MAYRLNPQVTASGQIEAADVAGLAEEGYKAVVTARPDGEVPGQPDHQTIAAAAQTAGLRHTYLPVTPGVPPSPEEAKRFAEEAADGPVFAYCGAGPRVIMLASLAAATSGREMGDILADAKAVGFDITTLTPLLRQYGEDETAG